MRALRHDASLAEALVVPGVQDLPQQSVEHGQPTLREASVNQAYGALKELADAIDKRTTLAWAVRYAPKTPDAVIVDAWRATASSRLREIRDLRRSLLARVGRDPEELVDGPAPLWASEKNWNSWWRGQVDMIGATSEAPTFMELLAGQP